MLIRAVGNSEEYFASRIGLDTNSYSTHKVHNFLDATLVHHRTTHCVPGPGCQRESSVLAKELYSGPDQSPNPRQSSAVLILCVSFFSLQIREYEEYLNRRHAVCNGKEEDLDVLQNVNELFVWCCCCYDCLLLLLYLWCARLEKEVIMSRVVSKSEINLL